MDASAKTPKTPADFRAEFARRRFLIYRVAAVVELSPSRLSAVLNERAPLTPDLAARLQAVLEADAVDGVAS